MRKEVKMQHKKISVFAVMGMFLLMTIFMGKSTQAASCDINSTTFPDEYFRNYVLTNIDTNKDKKLSQEEMDAVTSIEIKKFISDADDVDDEADDFKGMPHYKPEEYSLDLKGIGWFKKCKKISINFNCGWGMVDGYGEDIPIAKLKNINSLYKCKEVTSLYLFNVDLTSVDVSKLPKLNKLDLFMLKKLKNLLGSSTSLTDLSISQADVLASLPLANYKNLKKLNLVATPKLSSVTIYHDKLTSLGIDEDETTSLLKTVTIRKAPQLKNVSLLGSNKVKSLDFANAPVLKTLYIDKYNSLTSLSLKKNKKLEEISIWDSKGLTSMNLFNNPKVTWITLDGTKITSVTLAKNNKLNYIRWANNSSLKVFKVKNINKKTVTGIQVYGNKNLKSIDIRPYKNLEEIVVSKKYTKVTKNKGQSVRYN